MNVREKYNQITLKLIERGLTITTMESCTSGQIASLLTDTEGSSAIIKGAFVTYSNEAKIKQGVPKETIDKYGVYSEETAASMAKEARKAYDADIAIGVTGTMGNVDPANNDSVPGTVFFAISTAKDIYIKRFEVAPKESRLEYKLAVCDVIADCLLNLLKDI
ncbi:nicotinamide-nucleotide amidase [Butyrivibrio sp. INlla18]|uniref:CinA family protein n=1 Tax=Butyrivibrio sp. INlla18 TaxID=1520806 RepID=UPI00088DFF64|nr:CinA family protein [Butyrivibrio sp. INlla18]SDA75222.1 nicotinamide-nucleotide amidase [Butyrivibrio sp. INlla18]